MIQTLPLSVAALAWLVAWVGVLGRFGAAAFGGADILAATSTGLMGVFVIGPTVRTECSAREEEKSSLISSQLHS